MFIIPNKQKQNHVHNFKLTNTKWQMQSQTFCTLLLLTSQCCFANVVPFEVSWQFFKHLYFYFRGLWKLLSQKFRPSWVSDKIMQNRYPLLEQSWKHVSFVQTLTGLPKPCRQANPRLKFLLPGCTVEQFLLPGCTVAQFLLPGCTLHTPLAI